MSQICGNAAKTIDGINSFSVSDHARLRMGQRGVSEEAVELALTYGRKIHSRGAVFYVIGRKEISKLEDDMPEIATLDGVQVIASSDGSVITVYKNHDLRAIRPTKRCCRHQH